MKYWSMLKSKRPVFRTVDIRSGHITRQEVRGKLNPVKITLNSFSQTFNRFGLGESWCTFHKQMPIGKQGDEKALDKLFLADYLVFQPFS
jgi:hypothetical protein